MVLEPLSAFSLACNVIQVIEVGCKVLAGAADYRRASDGVLTEQRELRETSRTLNNLSVSLRTSLASQTTVAQQSPEERRLLEANNECLKLSNEFINFLDKLKVKDRHATLESIRMSIKARWYRDRMDSMKQALSEARDNLNIAFLLYMHSQQKIRGAQQDDTVEATAVRIENSIVAAVTSSSGSIQDEIRKLAEQLKDTYLDSDESTADDFISSHGDVLQDILQQLTSIGTSQSQVQSTNAQERTLVAEQRILSSLRFNKIDARREQVHVAHASTYNWMLYPLSQDWHEWDCFSTWLRLPECKSRLYWIHGKPGSGKSTIMRFLDDNIELTDHLEAWAEGQEALKVQYFFWASGTSLQKSLSGLYRALLFQLLEQKPSMMPTILSQRRWKIAQLSGDETAMQWTDSELRNTLADFLQCAHKLKVLFLIDGLDEFEGTDDEQNDLVDYLLNLSTSNSVKVCVSSRPLNHFKEAFIHCPQLRLEDLTRKDIQTYTISQLERNRRWQYLEQHLPGDATALVTQIIEKAAGVFLWVRLVVNGLIKGLRDGDSLLQLKHKLQTVPVELDDYFMRIIDKIELQHRRETSILLQLALHEEHEFASVFTLCLADILFIEESDEAFAAKPSTGLKTLLAGDSNSLSFLIDSTLRKLSSRCMGLLECIDADSGKHCTADADRGDTNTDTTSLQLQREEFGGGRQNPRNITSLDLIKTRIEFLHRSLRDFLLKPAMQKFLHKYTDGPFDCRLFLANARVLQFFALMETGLDIDLTIGTASHVLSALTFSQHSQAAAELAGSIQQGIEVLVKWHELGTKGWYISSSFYAWEYEKSNYLSLAIDFRLISYVAPRLTPMAIQNKEGRPILDYILRPRFANLALGISKPCPELELVRIALECGANPNEIYHMYGVSVWALFLSFSCEQLGKSASIRDERTQQSTWLQVVELLVHAGAIPLLSRRSLSVVTGHGRSMSRFCITTPLAQRSFWFQQQWPKASPIRSSVDADTSEPLYSVSDLLEQFRDYFGPSIDAVQQILKAKETQYINDLLSSDTD